MEFGSLPPPAPGRYRDWPRRRSPGRCRSLRLRTFRDEARAAALGHGDVCHHEGSRKAEGDHLGRGPVPGLPHARVGPAPAPRRRPASPTSRISCPLTAGRAWGGRWPSRPRRSRTGLSGKPEPRPGAPSTSSTPSLAAGPVREPWRARERSRGGPPSLVAVSAARRVWFPFGLG